MTRRDNPDTPDQLASRLAAVGSSVSDAVLVLDDEHRVLWGNEAARHAFETGGQGLEGRSCHQLIFGRRRPCDPATEICPIATVRITGEPESVEKTLKNASGERVPCVVSVHPVLGPAGEILEFVLTRRDRSSDDIWRVLQQQTDDLDLIHSLSEMANRGLGRDDILAELSKRLRALFTAPLASVSLLDPSRQRLTLPSPGVAPKIQAAIERITRAPTVPVVVPLERAPFLMAALHSDTASVVTDRSDLLVLMAETTMIDAVRQVLSPILRVIGMRAGVLIPLVADGQPIGLLCIGRGASFTSAELRRLENIAGHAASAIARQQLMEDRGHLNRRQALLLQAVADGVLGLSSDAEVVFANTAATSLLGRSQVQLLGLNIHDLCWTQKHGEQPCAEDCPVQRALEERRARYDVEGTLRRVDGQPIPVRLSVVPSNEPDLSMVLTMRDVSEQIRHREQEQRSTERLRRSFAGTVAALRRLAEMRDPYTAGHEGRVAQLARAIAQRMDLDEDVVDVVRLAATIHDIGKHAVPVEILTKPGALSAHEWELIRTHPLVGWEILSQAEFPEPIATIVRQHHERLDGSGYPDGISGDAITIEARIIAVADVVEAMASHRPYRASRGLEDALFEIQRNKGTHFDPQAVSACLRVFRQDGFDFA